MWWSGHIYNSPHHNQIGYINLSHCCDIFRSSAHEIFASSYALSFIFIPGKLGFVSCITVQFYNVGKKIECIMARWSYSFFAHDATSLSSLCRRIWRYWTYKMLVKYIISSVCLILSHFPQSSSMQYMVLCVSSIPISLMMIVRIRVVYLIIIITSEVWPICHCLGLGQGTMVCAVCLSIYSVA